MLTPAVTSQHQLEEVGALPGDRLQCLRCGRELEKGEQICPSCRTPRGKRSPEKLLSEKLSPPATLRGGSLAFKRKTK